MADIAVSIPYLPQIIVLVLAIAVIFVALKIGKKLMLLLINSFLGILGLLLVNLTPFVDVQINLASILIAGLGGLLGIAILVALSLAGIAV